MPIPATSRTAASAVTHRKLAPVRAIPDADTRVYCRAIFAGVRAKRGDGNAVVCDGDPMRRAAKIDANQPEIVEALRKAGCQVHSAAPLGRGAPDLIVNRGGRGGLYLLEVKAANGSLTPAQRKWHALWPVHVVRSPEEALRAVGL